jgi:hypothetical protein
MSWLIAQLRAFSAAAPEISGNGMDIIPKACCQCRKPFRA